MFDFIIIQFLIKYNFGMFILLFYIFWILNIVF